MDKIKISSADRSMSVEMPRIKDISVGATEVANTVTMASGKVVKDMIGYRTTLQATWDFVPVTTLTALATLLRSGGFFYVEYPSPTGDAKGMFEIEYPSMTIFAYKNGIAVWHDVQLKMTAQEVSA